MLNFDNKRNDIQALEYFTFCFFACVLFSCLRVTYIYAMISFRPSRTRPIKRDYDDDKKTTHTHKRKVVIRFDMVACLKREWTDKMALSEIVQLCIDFVCNLCESILVMN